MLCDSSAAPNDVSVSILGFTWNCWRWQMKTNRCLSLLYRWPPRGCIVIVLMSLTMRVVTSFRTLCCFACMSLTLDCLILLVSHGNKLWKSRKVKTPPTSFHSFTDVCLPGSGDNTTVSSSAASKSLLQDNSGQQGAVCHLVWLLTVVLEQACRWE